MNERIRQLADKIWEERYWTNPNTDRLLPAQLDKFAELIVLECMYVGRLAQINNQLVDSEIKDHFGFEE